MLFAPLLISFFAAIAGTERHRPTNGSAGHHRIHRNHSHHLHHHNRTGFHNRNRTHERRHRNITTGVRLSSLLHGGNETNLGILGPRRKHQNKTTSSLLPVVTASTQPLIIPSITNTTKIAILYVFTVVEAVCENGLPSYMKVSLEQAIFANPDCIVYLASNFGACNTTLLVANSVPGLQKIDTTAIESRRTQTFRNNSLNMFMSDHYAELWTTSALRFFLMEDVMARHGIHEVIHVEGDNLLYGSLSSIVPTLRKNYQGLAATPLNHPLVFITASVFWISSFSAIVKLNDFFLELSTLKKLWREYLLYLQKNGAGKPGFGVDAVSREIGIKPYAINEMSILAYFRQRNKSALHNLPVTPPYKYYKNRYVCDMADYSPTGKEIKAPLGKGIFDPNSWGQYLGGTHSRHGRDKKFTDATHIIGMAIRLNPSCLPEIRCSNITIPDGNFIGNASCYTAPFVRCSPSLPWTLIWNLHVHSKHTSDFKSKPCVCGS